MRLVMTWRPLGYRGGLGAGRRALLGKHRLPKTNKNSCKALKTARQIDTHVKAMQKIRNIPTMKNNAIVGK